MEAGAKIINVGLDDLLVRAWATDFNKLREADLDDHGGYLGILAGAGAALEVGEEIERSERRYRPASRRLGQDLRRQKAGLEKEI